MVKTHGLTHVALAVRDASGGDDVLVGGDDYRGREPFSACEPVATGSVCLWQTKQGEHGAPSFELWDIALGVTFRAPPSAPAR